MFVIITLFNYNTSLPTIFVVWSIAIPVNDNHYLERYLNRLTFENVLVAFKVLNADTQMS
jgi:hypothetical protein